MLKKAACIAALALMAACSSESVSDQTVKDSATQEQPTAQSSGVEDYEVNETTISGSLSFEEFAEKINATVT